MNKITIKKLLTLENINLIDIRNHQEFNNFHLNCAVNIEFLTLYNNFNNLLNKQDTYYIICESGYRSKKLIKKLSKYGYKLILVKKGYNKLNQYNF